MSMYRNLLFITAIAMSFTLGCKRSRKSKNYREYMFVFLSQNVPEGATLFAGSRQLGHVYLHRQFGRGMKDEYRVTTRIPKGELFGATLMNLTLQIETPCGPMVRKVEHSAAHHYYKTRFSPEHEKRRWKKYPDFTMAVPIVLVQDKSLPSPPKTIVYTDFAASDTRLLMIGKMVIPTRRRSYRADTKYLPRKSYHLFDLGCQPSHPVTLDGKTIGRVTAATTPRALLISSDSNACYRARYLFYAGIKSSNSMAGSSSHDLPKSQVIPLPFDKFTYFLQRAPSSGTKGTSNTELIRIPCR